MRITGYRRIKMSDTRTNQLLLLNLSSKSESDDAEEEILLYSLIKTKFKSPNKYILSERKRRGQFKITTMMSDSDFTNYFRMNRNQFSEVHEMIRQDIDSTGCNAQRPIATEEKLAVFMRYLASGDTYKSISYNYLLGDRTVSNIVQEVAVAIWNNMQKIYLPEPTTDTWKSIASRFEQRWQFPHCIGALDGKHIVIKKPNKSGSSYFNYKHTFSIVLMATVDADYKFITVDVGAMGRFSDGNIFASSALGRKMRKHTLLLLSPERIPTISDPVPYVFVGDEAFPLSENLMRPYPRRHVTGNYEHQVFNARLSRARQTVECAFGVLSSRFRVFRKPFETKVETVKDVVKAACVLHNYLRSSTAIPEDVSEIEQLPQTQLLHVQGSRVRNSSAAFRVRQNFTEYFNNWGAVPWQHQSVILGNY